MNSHISFKLKWNLRNANSKKFAEFEWYKRFKEGQEDVKGDGRSEDPKINQTWEENVAKDITSEIW